MTSPSTFPETSTLTQGFERRIAELEAQLASSEQQLQFYQKMVERAPSLLSIYDLGEQRNMYTNGRLSRMMGYAQHELPQMSDNLFAMSIHPDDLPAVADTRARLMHTSDGEILEVRYRMRHADGGWRWLWSRETVFVRDAAGVPTQSLGSVYEVTDQVQRENELIMLKAAVDHAPDGIGVSDMHGIQVYANPAFQAMLGYGPDLIGMSSAIYTHYNEQDVQSALMPIGIYQGLLLLHRKDGSTFTCESTSFIIRDASGQPQWMGGVVRDVTEQQRADEERLALQEQLINAQQVALRELSTPLIPLDDGVVVMPLIGSIDTQRAQQVLEELLGGVAAHHARTAILDITACPWSTRRLQGRYCALPRP